MNKINPPKDTNIIKITIRETINTFVCSYYKLSKSKIFILDGISYNYFFHKHTWNDERVVEIPIIWEMIKRYKDKNILEVGNVLSHYISVNHDILDKYEKKNGVINEDVVDFKPSKKYDLIVSISTLEHVGWDEKPYEQPKIPSEPQKILHAVENMKSALAPGGRLVFTVPIGYNPDIDNLLNQNNILFTRTHCLKRISADNKWLEVEWKDICDAKYFAPFPAANALFVGIIDKD